MSEMSHKRARLLIQQQHLSPEGRTPLATHLGRCEECRQYAAVHMLLARELQLRAVRTRPAPTLRAAFLERVERHHRRSQIMNPIKALATVAVLAVVLIIGWQMIGSNMRQPDAVSSVGGVATEIPTRTPRPTLTPLPTSTTQTPDPVLRQVVSPEDLVGVWGYCASASDCYYYQYNEDGTYYGSATASRERLENAPSITGEFWFEGNQLYLNVIEDTLTEVWSCIGNIGVYEVQLLENGMLRFELIEDECGIRSEDLPGFEHERVELTD